MERLICIAIGYAFGLIQTGYFYGKINKVDIREHGSGNAGTTNALRTLGYKAAVVTYLGDCFKCVLAVVLVHLLFGQSSADKMPLLAMYAGAGAVLGHNYPFYLRFKGGKGIAATSGLILATNIWMALIELVIFVAVVAGSRYVSLGSLVVVTVFVVEVVVYGQSGGFNMEPALLYETYAITVLLMLSAFYKHRANIKRLLNGTENKLGTNKKDS
ncbi:MAG: glycerol-3-phosphate 1-O-acyltransferase PlsY [Lachnospiraceae bacterium]